MTCPVRGYHVYYLSVLHGTQTVVTVLSVLEPGHCRTVLSVLEHEDWRTVLSVLEPGDRKQFTIKHKVLNAVDKYTILLLLSVRHAVACYSIADTVMATLSLQQQHRLFPRPASASLPLACSSLMLPPLNRGKEGSGSLKKLQTFDIPSCM